MEIMMVEVFKTNVASPHDAAKLVKLIHDSFRGYTANFDLEDCDRILRINNIHGVIDSAAMVNLLAQFDFEAVILGDEVPAPF